MPVTHELQYLCRTVTTQRTFSSLQTENHVYALTLAYLASKANTRNKVQMKKCANIQFKYEWHKCVSTRWVNEQKKGSMRSLWHTTKQFQAITLIITMSGFCSLVSGARSTGSSCRKAKAETEKYNSLMTWTIKE